MIKVPYNAEHEREIDLIAKGVYAACQAAANSTPLIGYIMLLDENGNPVKWDGTPVKASM